MKKLLRKIAHPVFRRYYNWYHRKPRNYSYRGTTVPVYPGVFSPHFTTTTKNFLEFLKTKELKQMKLLELGCGCGIISAYAWNRGANVTATDISPVVVGYFKKFTEEQGMAIDVIHSDLLDNVSVNEFHYVIINPPFYPKLPKNDTEKAWYCGERFEYFKKLFYQLGISPKNQATVWMILSEDCDIEKIKSIASKNNLHLTLQKEIRKWNEVNYIFEVGSGRF